MTGAVVILLAVAAQAAEWKEFKSKEGRFSVQFPGEPKVTEREGAKPMKLVFHVVLLETPDGSTAYLVMYNDYPAGLLGKSKPEKLLTAGRDGAMKSAQGAALVSDAPARLAGYPGRDFTFTALVSGKKAHIWNRMFLVKDRLYQVRIVAMDDAPLAAADREKFFASFQLADAKDEPTK